MKRHWLTYLALVLGFANSAWASTMFILLNTQGALLFQEPNRLILAAETAGSLAITTLIFAALVAAFSTLKSRANPAT